MKKRISTFDKNTNRTAAWYNNFCDSLSYHYSSKRRLTISDFDKIHNTALKNYNAKIVRTPGNFPEVVFDTDEDYVMFMLRWS